MSRRIAPTVLVALALAAPALAQDPVPAPAPAPVPVMEGSPVVPAQAVGDADENDASFWIQADYVLGWVKGDTLPPLATTSPAGTAQVVAGVPGAPGTAVLFGDNTTNVAGRSGGRVDLGYSFGSDHVFGVEAGFLILSEATTSFATNSNATPIIARPIINAVTMVPASVLVAFPGVATGSINITDTAHPFYGANVDVTENFARGSWYRLESMLGWRYLRYDETLEIDSASQPMGAAVVPGSQIAVTDRFATQNEFNGLDLGFRAEFTDGPWTLDLLGRIPVGQTRRDVTIFGSTTTTVPGTAPVTRVGGLLALSSNIGTHEFEDYGTVPQLDVTVGWQVMSSLRVQVGYSALYWFNTALPGGQVNPTVNTNLIPGGNAAAGGPTQPAVTGARENLWLQALNLGVQFRY